MSNEFIGVIAAAGRGIRLYPNTDTMQKSLLSVGDRPIIEQNICLMRDQLTIKIFYILVGYKKQQIMDHLGSGEKLGVAINYIEIEDIKKGLAYGILQLKKFISGIFCVILGDEFYYHSNHYELLNFLKKILKASAKKYWRAICKSSGKPLPESIISIKACYN